jgi:DNA-binding response OmpR family regulator
MRRRFGRSSVATLMTDAVKQLLVLENDLVISDLALLRGYDSEEAVRQVRALRSVTAGPVRVLTAHHAAASDGELAREATAVMATPFDLEALLASVATLTGFQVDPDPHEGSTGI